MTIRNLRLAKLNKLALLISLFSWSKYNSKEFPTRFHPSFGFFVCFVLFFFLWYRNWFGIAVIVDFVQYTSTVFAPFLQTYDGAVSFLVSAINNK